MRVLAIDTGTEESGWVVFDSDTWKLHSFGITENEELRVLIDSLEFDDAALEYFQSYGMPMGQTTIDSIQWCGRFKERILVNGVEATYLWKKKHINKVICGGGKVKDAHIRQALLNMYPPNGGGKTPQIGTKKEQGDLFGVSSHVWAALAVAVTHAIQEGYTERRDFTNLVG